MAMEEHKGSKENQEPSPDGENLFMPGSTQKID